MAHILYVDDCPMSRHTVQTVLQKSGHQVTLADSAEQGMKLIEKTSLHFDLFMIDFDMEETHGIQMGKMIRSETRYQQTPMVMHTACNLPDIKNAATQAGFNDFFVKGEYDRQEMLDRIHSLLLDANAFKQVG